MSTSTIEFSCTECGSKRFRYPNTPPQPDDIIACDGCGKSLGRYADVREQAIGLAKAGIDKAVQKAFGKKPTWR